MVEGILQKSMGRINRVDLQNKYYSVKTAAKFMDCSEQLFRNWVRDRKITFVKFGRLVRIPTSEIEKLKKRLHRIVRIN